MVMPALGEEKSEELQSIGVFSEIIAGVVVVQAVVAAHVAAASGAG